MTTFHLVEQLAEACVICGQNILYSSDVNNEQYVGYDAKFCKRCDRWLEGTCEDPLCKYCPDRPPKPSLVHYTEVGA